MARTLTEREALHYVYNSIVASLQFGDIRIGFVENEATDYSDEDYDYMLSIIDRVREQMERKVDEYAKPLPEKQRKSKTPRQPGPSTTELLERLEKHDYYRYLDQQTAYGQAKLSGDTWSMGITRNMILDELKEHGEPVKDTWYVYDNGKKRDWR